MKTPLRSMRMVQIASIVMILNLPGLTLVSSFAGDFSFYSIGKGLYYDQLSGGPPVLKSPMPWLFQAQLVAQSNAVSAAFLFENSPPFPFGVLKAQLNHLNNTNFWTKGLKAATQSQLDVLFPNTNYWFQVLTLRDGWVYVTNSMTTGTFPPAPNVTNLVAAQSVDATQDFTLGWDAFSTGTPSDFIYCQLQNTSTVFHTTFVPGTIGALDGTATSVTVPAATLLPGHAYLARVVFARRVATSTSTYGSAFGATYLFSQTDLWVRTQGPGDNTPPEITLTSPTNGSTGVPTNAPIAIYFSEPMNPGVRYSVSGFQSGGSGVGGGSSVFLRSDWSPDSTLFVVASLNSLNAAHIVSLNPFDSPPAFADQRGNPLAPETAFTFTDGGGYLKPTPAVFTNVSLAPDGTFRAKLVGESNYLYTLQASGDFTNWSNLKSNIAFQGIAHFDDTNTSDSFRFYRTAAR